MSVNKNKGLGKGFDALMPSGVDSGLINRGEERVQNLFIADIFPNQDQPRREFKESLLLELSDSIKQYGVLQPLIVTPDNGKYKIIAGERRWRASKLAGLNKVPVVVRTSKELEQLEISIVENIQRVDLSPLEQALSIVRLHEIFGVSYEEIAKRLNKAESTISNIARLLQLPEKAQEALKDNSITEGHARAILALRKFPEQQSKLLELIKSKHWSVRQAEQFVVAVKSEKGSNQEAHKKASAISPQTERLSKILDRPVSVNNMAKGGRLIIRFKSDEDLDNLVDLMSAIENK